MKSNYSSSLIPRLSPHPACIANQLWNNGSKAFQLLHLSDSCSSVVVSDCVMKTRHVRICRTQELVKILCRSGGFKKSHFLMVVKTKFRPSLHGYGEPTECLWAWWSPVWREWHTGWCPQKVLPGRLRWPPAERPQPSSESGGRS